MIITLANQKGGVSKSTTAAALCCLLREAGKRVLAVDADPQASLSYLLGADLNGPGLLEFLQGKEPDGKPLDRIIQHTEQADILAGSIRLAAEAGKIQPERLRLSLGALSRKYKYIIIDTGPGLSALLLQALIAADTVIIPTTADAEALLGLRNVCDTIKTAEDFGPFEKKVNALITQSNSRKSNSEAAIEEAIRRTCAELEIHLYRQQIRRAAAPIKTAAALRQSIVTYDPKSKPAQDYKALLQEMKLL